MIILVKSLNKGIFGKVGIIHWAFLDTQKNLIYSYEYDIVGDKFKNGKVKRYTYNEYENIVDSDVTYTKLNTYFDLNNYLNYTSEKATCMDFCLDIMEKESVSIEIINSAYDEYIEVKKEIKKTGMSYFLAFVLGGIIGILSFICIMLLLFDFNFINYI